DVAEGITEARATGYNATHRLNDALFCIDFWLKWRPHARQARMWRADIWERTERWSEAVKEYRSIVEHDPRDYEARLKLAGALLSVNHPRAALREYEKCLEPGR